MKKTHIPTFIALMVGFAIMWSILFSLAGIYLFKADSKPVSYLSPDRSKILSIDINRSKDDLTKYLSVKFEILDATTNKVLFAQQTGASDRMGWSMEWVDDKKVKLNSSDIGTYCWEEQETGEWAETEC